MRRSKCPCCAGRGTIPPLVNSKQVREMFGIKRSTLPSKFFELMDKLEKDGFLKKVQPKWPEGYHWYRKDIKKYIKDQDDAQ